MPSALVIPVAKPVKEELEARFFTVLPVMVVDVDVPVVAVAIPLTNPVPEPYETMF
jgi:hypothetical protein